MNKLLFVIFAVFALCFPALAQDVSVAPDAGPSQNAKNGAGQARPAGPVCLGTYTTSFRAENVNRTSNLKTAVKAINGRALKPGEVFSYNKTLGKRTSAAGYKKAVAFSGGSQVLELGGGICQVSSTLFNAVILSGLEIKSRRSHSRMVDYVPAGRDAMVYWGQQDFSFRNNTGHEVTIKASIQGNRLTASVWGSASALKKCTVVSKASDNGRRATVTRTVEKNGVKSADYPASSASGSVIGRKELMSSVSDNSLQLAAAVPAAPAQVPAEASQPALPEEPPAETDPNEGLGFE